MVGIYPRKPTRVKGGAGRGSRKMMAPFHAQGTSDHPRLLLHRRGYSRRRNRRWHVRRNALAARFLGWSLSRTQRIRRPVQVLRDQVREQESQVVLGMAGLFISQSRGIYLAPLQTASGSARQAHGRRRTRLSLAHVTLGEGSRDPGSWLIHAPGTGPCQKERHQMTHRTQLPGLLDSGQKQPGLTLFSY